MAPTIFVKIPKYPFLLLLAPTLHHQYFFLLSSFPFFLPCLTKLSPLHGIFFFAFDISTESWNYCAICTMESEFFYFFCFQAINMIPLCYKFIIQWNLDFIMLQTLSHNRIIISLYYKFCNGIILPLCYGSMKKCFRCTKWGRIFFKNENDCRGH